ncbi:MAG: hypothetical protein ACJAV5_000696 [Vicingaceae bacterium]|jgi:hypothetical protein
MRYFKHFLALLIIIAIGVLPTLMVEEDNYTVLYSAAGVLVLYQLISFANRRNLRWKSFYTSPFNLLTAKRVEVFQFDIESGLLFDKAKEVLIQNGIKIKSTDDENKILLVVTSISLKSWGEKIYVTINRNGSESSELIYEIVAFQVYTWGKNEDNASDFKEQLEESFII